jgi:hypothetical protein
MRSWKAVVAIASLGDVTIDTKVSAASDVLMQLNAYICVLSSSVRLSPNGRSHIKDLYFI